MSDVMNDVKKIEVIGTIKDGVAIGIKNIGPILVNLLLWALTIWIPYLNVGTTIGLFVGIITKAARNEPVSMTEIFDKKYRQYMGEFFLTSGFVGIGVSIGFVFFVIPGFVISIAWMFALLLAIDKGKNPTEAISISNKCTYGNKGKIFGVFFLVTLIYFILCLIFGLIMNAIPFLGIILMIAAVLLYMFVIIGIQASMYKQLTENVC